MCLIVLAWHRHPDYALLLAANRDEFHRRPSAPAAYWEDAPSVLAGRDLEAGGTWLGVSRRGRFAAITNIRDPGSEGTAPRSRGELTRRFLEGDESPREYLAGVHALRGQYQGFNLLVADGEALWYLHGAPGEAASPHPLAPGIYALSNAALDVPWPKVERARRAMSATLEGGAGPAPDAAALRACVADRQLAAASQLHGSDMSGEMARRLSAQFIVTPEYGTRCTTTLRWHRAGGVEFTEQRFAADGACCGEDEHAFTIDAA
jgi:uncharacterized protein with NRDE domain